MNSQKRSIRCGCVSCCRVFLINTVHMQAAAQPSHENPPSGMRLIYYPNVNPMTCLKPNFPHFELRYSTVEVSI